MAIYHSFPYITFFSVYNIIFRISTFAKYSRFGLQHIITQSSTATVDTWILLLQVGDKRPVEDPEDAQGVPRTHL